MIVQCQKCDSVRKFGEWVKPPKAIKLVDKTEIIKTVCDFCQEIVAEKVVLHGA